METKNVYENRKRALESITKNEWLKYNSLFKTYVAEFDMSFNRGVSQNMNYYVKRNTNTNEISYEDSLCISLFPTEGDENVKLSYLTAKVGNGKTCLCRYIKGEKSPLYEDTICIYIDTWSHRTINDSIFRDTILKVLKEKEIVKNKAEFCNRIFENQGFTGKYKLSMSDQLDRYETITARELIDYIDSLSGYHKVLITIDNIDECDKELIENSRDFAIKLKTSCGSKKKYGILIPARGHTAKKYFDQKIFADNQLPPMDPIAIIRSHFLNFKDIIQQETKNYSQKIEYPKTNDGRYSTPPNITISITPATVIYFIDLLLKTLDKEPAFWKLLLILANGNYRRLVCFCYNFIHSCKLPLVPLFNRVWNPLLTDVQQNNIPFNLGLETLLAIHYPFYDVEASHIVNVFNLKSSHQSGDFQNSLATPRVLCYLKNKKEQDLSEIKNYFKNYSYDNIVINDVIEKCFGEGLIDSEHGNYVKDLSDESRIKLSTIGHFYLDVLICNDTYLSFMTDDIPMPIPYQFTILDKYEKSSDNRETFPKIIEQYTDKLIHFVEMEEKAEKILLESRGYSYNDFLSQSSIVDDKNSYSISQYIKANRNKRVALDVLDRYL